MPKDTLRKSSDSPNWQYFKGSHGEWDDLIVSLDGNYRQLYLWGERQNKLGWTVDRIIATSNNKYYTAQVLSKKVAFLHAYYIPGGVSGDKHGYADILPWIKKKSKRCLFYVKLDSNYELNVKGEDYFLKDKWLRPRYAINSAKTLYIKLSDNLDFLMNASRRWRKQLKNAALNPNIKTTIKVCSKDIDKASAMMQNYKNIYLRDDPKNVTALIALFGGSMITISAYDEKDNILGFRAALLIKDRAWDFYASTTPTGRKLDVGYILMHELIQVVQKKECCRYILPLSKSNHGDTEFKRRIGGDEIALMGEWEHSNSRIFRWAMNLVIYLKLNSSLILFIQKRF